MSSMMRSIRLRGADCALPLTNDVHHGLNVDVCQFMFHSLRLGKLTWYGDGLRSCLDKNSVIVYWILNNWLDDGVRNMGIFPKIAILQLVHMNLLVRSTLVTLLFVRVTLVNLLLVRMTRLRPGPCERSGFSFVAVLQTRVAREVCFRSVPPPPLSQVVSDLQRDLTRSVILECSSVRTSELNGPV